MGRGRACAADDNNKHNSRGPNLQPYPSCLAVSLFLLFPFLFLSLSLSVFDLSGDRRAAFEHSGKYE